MPLFGPPNVRKLKAKGNIKGLVQALNYQKDATVRKAAAVALEQIGDERAVKPLIDALRWAGDGTGDVRAAAIEALAQLGSCAVEPLITVLGHHHSPRREATNALVRLGSYAVEPLVATLKSGGFLEREHAAEALGQIGDKRAVEPLITAFRKIVQDQRVREAAAKALGEFGSSVVEPLIAALKDENRVVRKLAAEVLGHIGDERAVEPLIAALKPGQYHISSGHAVTALGQIGNKRAIEPLLTHLMGKNDFIREHAAKALDQLGWQPDRGETGAAYWIAKRDWDKCVEIGAKAVKPLITALQSDADYIRVPASKALNQIDDPQTVDQLISALTDNRKYIRETAARMLGDIRDTRAISPLIAALDDKAIRKIAAKALEKIGWEPEPTTDGPTYWMTRGEWDKFIEIGEPAVDPLIFALKDKKFSDAAAKTLIRIGAPAVEPLIAALQSKQKHKILADVLGNIGDKRAIEPLIIALHDKNWSMCKAAAENLDRLNWQPCSEKDEAAYWIAKCDWDKCIEIGAPAVDPLIVTLKKGPWTLRKSVAKTLGDIGNTRAVEPLINAFQNQGNKVREAAARVLGQLGDKKAVKPLIAALGNDKEWDVREAAARALGQIGDQRAVQPLIGALNMIHLPRSYYGGITIAIRRAAVYSLGQIGDARAVEPLISLLDSRRIASAGAKDALVMIGEPAIEPLIETLKDKKTPRIVQRKAGEALEELNWRPDNDEDRATYWIAKQEWNKCVQVGTFAVEPLIEALTSDSLYQRRGAAGTLVTLYQSGNLDEPSMQRILAHRYAITRPHKDISASSDCSHTDAGIGVDFPV